MKTPSSNWGARTSCHPVLDTGSGCMQQRWRFEGVFVWFPDQVRDGYRPPGLEEDAVVIRRTFLKKIKPCHPSKQRMNLQRSSIVLWKLTFYTLKDNLLAYERRPIVMSWVSRDYAGGCRHRRDFSFIVLATQTDMAEAVGQRPFSASDSVPK